MSSNMKLTENRALVFDVYGTLVDWESAIHNALLPVFPDLAREESLAKYAVVEGSLQNQLQSTPYSDILALAYRQLAATVATPAAGSEQRGDEQHAPASSVNVDGISTAAPSVPDNAQCFAGSIADWKPFPDTINALHRLKKYFALVVLSNVDDKSFAGTHARLCTHDHPGSAYRTVTPDSPFSLILTAQQVGAYKPNPAMLESALRQISAHPDPLLPSNSSVRVDSSEVLVVANSIRHDIIPAMQHKIRSVWISRHGVNLIGNEGSAKVHHSDREGATVEGKRPYTWRYETLGGLADAVEREVQKEA